MNFDELMAGMLMVIGLWLYDAGYRHAFNRRNSSGQEVFPFSAGNLIALRRTALLGLRT